VSDVEWDAHERGCGIRLTAEVHEPIDANPGLLRSAIENVLHNGVRHTASGTDVHVTVERATGAVDEVEIHVADHGSGVPDDDLTQIFRPFYRAVGARDRQSGGAGLGLAIADRTVRAHGGSIRASNRPGGGLDIAIRLPVRRASRPRPG
jgi:two-component system sensor histidine kinase CpxA